MNSRLSPTFNPRFESRRSKIPYSSPCGLYSAPHVRAFMSFPKAHRRSLLLEQNNEWQLQHRYMQLEGLQSLSDNQVARLSAVVS
jgi:hypothetical protein